MGMFISVKIELIYAAFLRILSILVSLVPNLICNMSVVNSLDTFFPECREAVLLKQAQMKAEKRRNMYSQGAAINQIIKEWLEMKSGYVENTKKPS